MQTHGIQRDIYILNFSYHTNRTKMYNNFNPIGGIQEKLKCTNLSKLMINTMEKTTTK